MNIDDLLALAQDEEEDWTLRSDAIVKLGDLGDQRAALPLIKALQDEEWKIREDSAEALGKMGVTEAIEPLIPLLDDEDDYVREDVVLALGRLKAVQAVDSLCQKALNNQEVRGVRLQAVLALGAIGDKSALKAIETLVSDRDDTISKAAQDVLKILES